MSIREVLVDLGRIISVLWKRKTLIFAGMVLGIMFSFLSVYKVDISFNDQEPFLSYEPRVKTVYTTKTQLVLDGPNFGLGRISQPRDNEFEKTHDLSDLAAVYSYLIVSDQMKEKIIPELNAVNGEVQAEAVKDLPIVEVSVTGTSVDGVKDIAMKVSNYFIGYVTDEQAKNNIPPDQRTVIRLISKPSDPEPIESRASEIAFIVFLMPVFGAAFAAFALDNIERRRTSELSGSEE